jgi:hypothetical protein
MGESIQESTVVQPSSLLTDGDCRRGADRAQPRLIDRPRYRRAFASTASRMVVMALAGYFSPDTGTLLADDHSH